MEIQSANKQHPVPQNVMDVEFKLIGELTVRQFTYIVIFSGLIFLTFKSPFPGILTIPLIIIEFIFGLGFAFIPLNDVPMDKVVVNYIKAITNPRIRVWKHIPTTPYFFTLDTKNKKQKGGKKYSQTQQKKGLEDILNKKQDKPNFEDEKDLIEKEKEFIKKIGFNYKEKEVSDTKTQSKPKGVKDQTPQNTEKDHQEMQKEYSSIAISSSKNKKIEVEDKDSSEDRFETTSEENLAKDITKKDLDSKKGSQEEKKKIQSTDVPIQAPSQSEAKETPNFAKAAKDSFYKQSQNQDDKTKDKTEERAKSSPQETAAEKQETEKQYLKHLQELNSLKEKLIEEIERNRYKIVEGREKEIEEIATKEIQRQKEELKGLKEQNEQLAKKLKDLESRGKQQKANIPPFKTTEEKKEDIKAPHVKELNEENRKGSLFTGFLEKLQETGKNKDLPPLQDKKDNKIISENKKTESPLDTKKGRDNRKEKEEKSNNITTSYEEKKKNKPKVTIKEGPEVKKDPQTSVRDNIIKGSTHDQKDNLLEETIIIIKNEKGDPIRALKANKLGEFETSTPVSNGNYIIEAIKDGYNFKSVKVTASGSPISPVKLIGKQV